MLDDRHFKELNVLEVDVKRAVSYHVQTENWLIDENDGIRKIGSLSKQPIFNLHSIEKPGMILGAIGNELQQSKLKT